MRYASLAVVVMLLVGSAPFASAGDAATGKTLFNSNCAACHGSNGAGGVKIGTAVSADLRAPALETTYHHSDALIVRAILTGKDESGDELDKVMPRWKGTLSTAQASDIVAYLKTLCCAKNSDSDD